MKYPNKNKGIGAGIAAGIFWGTPFFVPIVLADFSAFEIMFGRFLFFGLISLCYLTRIIRLFKELSGRDFFQIFLFSATGYWLYTFFLFLGIKLTNGVIGSLIIGCIPLTLTLFSKPIFNTRLVFGLIFILTGMGFLLGVPLMSGGVHGSISLTGLLLLGVALASWTWFGIKNAQFLHKHPQIKAQDYSSIMGLLSFVIVLPIFALSTNLSTFIHHPHLVNFLGWSAVLGLGASWLSNMFWVYCSKNCPSSIIGALLISETLFALLYSFIYAWRLPFIHEIVAIVCLVFGVIVIVNSQSQSN